VGKPLEIWWQDEARVGQQGTLTRVWAQRGSRPAAPRDRRYTWAYVFGAVCPARGVGAGIVMPSVNLEAMSEHLRQISHRVAPGAHCLMQVDGRRLASTIRALDRALEHHAPDPAAILARTQSCRKYLAIFPRQLAEPPRMGELRRHRQRMLRCLEQSDGHA
jgi:hypothetical protein